MPRKKLDLVGQTFGKLTVLREGEGKREGKGKKYSIRSTWICECECGIVKEIVGKSLKSGATTSCGCVQRQTGKTHGMFNTRAWRCWAAMRNRCQQNRKYYEDVEVCKEWQDDFMAFYRHIGEPPTDKHTIDRIDGNKGYEPGNVRWATYKEQRANQRR